MTVLRNKAFTDSVHRGLYTRIELSPDFERQVLLACERVPHGVVCLESSLRLHGILATSCDPTWMAIDRKASPRLRFVRFSGNALTSGVVSSRIDGGPVGSTAWPKRLPTALSTAGGLARALRFRRCEKVSLNEHVAVKDSSISRRCAV
jgi:hypothetical protein